MKTDAQLKQDILDELSWDSAIHASEVGVAVKDGVVTLTGHLGTYTEKNAAERAVQRVQGVMGLALDIEVRLPAQHERDDADIAAAARNALTWSVAVPDDRIRLTVERGVVTLMGEVDWDHQRRAAERAVRDLVGIVGVVNLIRVDPRISPIDIQKKIQKALIRQAEHEAQHLQIIVEGSHVTLRGKVRSLAQRQAAQSVAYAAPGVTDVHNELTVAP